MIKHIFPKVVRRTVSEIAEFNSIFNVYSDGVEMAFRCFFFHDFKLFEGKAYYLEETPSSG